MSVGSLCLAAVGGLIAAAVGYWRYRWEKENPDRPRRRWPPPPSPPQ